MFRRIRKISAFVCLTAILAASPLFGGDWVFLDADTHPWGYSAANGWVVLSNEISVYDPATRQTRNYRPALDATWIPESLAGLTVTATTDNGHVETYVFHSGSRGTVASMGITLPMHYAFLQTSPRDGVLVATAMASTVHGPVAQTVRAEIHITSPDEGVFSSEWTLVDPWGTETGTNTGTIRLGR